MTTQSKSRFADALALSETCTMDTDKLSAVIDLVIPEDRRKILWKDIKQEEDATNGTITLLHLIIFAYSQTGFHTELERDAAYLICLKQIIGSSDDELSIYFGWYIQIPKKGFMTSETSL
jgi:hypothetical protein